VPFSIAGTESLKSTTIEPWRESQEHRFEDLIALCPNCHQMADRGEIDRKSLRLYKARLAAAFDWGSVVCSEEGSRHGNEGPWLTAEGRWETRTFQQSEATTGFEATLDYPEFLWPETAVAPLNEALEEVVRRQCKSEGDSYSKASQDDFPKAKASQDDFPKGAWLSGSFGVSAITASFVSVRFTLHSCVWGSHGHAWNVPLSYFLAPFRRKRHAEAALTARQFDVLDFVTLVGRRCVDFVDA
jgi:hypothetical protein